MNLKLPLLAALFLAALPSCAPRFTAEKRNAIQSVAITEVALKEGAYQEPSGVDHAVRNSASMAGVTSGTGALGGAVGALIGEGIAATQNHLFKKKSAQYFPTVEKNLPPIQNMLQQTLQTSFSQDPFYGPRLSRTADTRISSEIQSYGLVRSGKKQDGSLLLTTAIVTKLELLDPQGKSLSGGTFTGLGHNHPIETFASNRKILKDSFEESTKNAVNAFMKPLNP